MFCGHLQSIFGSIFEVEIAGDGPSFVLLISDGWHVTYQTDRKELAEINEHLHGCLT